MTLSEDPSNVLRRRLLAKHVDPMPSTSAEQVDQAGARETDMNTDLRVIGLGTCGAVFELPGSEIAYKKGADTAAVWNDFRLTNTMHNAIKRSRDVLQEEFEHVTIPSTLRCHEFFLRSQYGGKRTCKGAHSRIEKRGLCSELIGFCPCHKRHGRR